MSNVVLTGANGFLGWHLRIRHFAETQKDTASLSLGDRFILEEAQAAVSGATRLVTLQG